MVGSCLKIPLFAAHASFISYGQQTKSFSNEQGYLFWRFSHPERTEAGHTIVPRLSASFMPDQNQPRWEACPSIGSTFSFGAGYSGHSFHESDAL